MITTFPLLTIKTTLALNITIQVELAALAVAESKQDRGEVATLSGRLRRRLWGVDTVGSHAEYESWAVLPADERGLVLSMESEGPRVRCLVWPSRRPQVVIAGG